MSTATLTSLLEYLYGALTPSNMQWLGEHLIEQAQKEKNLEPCTKKELLDMAETGRQQIAEGKCYSTEEVFQFCEDRMSN
jgi:hypothetical protein